MSVCFSSSEKLIPDDDSAPIHQKAAFYRTFYFVHCCKMCSKIVHCYCCSFLADRIYCHALWSAIVIIMSSVCLSVSVCLTATKRIVTKRSIFQQKCQSKWTGAAPNKRWHLTMHRTNLLSDYWVLSIPYTDPIPSKCLHQFTNFTPNLEILVWYLYVSILFMLLRTWESIFTEVII